MKIYYSETGYVKNIINNTIYQTTVVYLGIYDSLNNYVDVSEEEYLEYVKQQLEVE